MSGDSGSLIGIPEATTIIAIAANAAGVVGLYMAPPENAIVIRADEKPSVQALERAQGYLEMPNGRALDGHSQDAKMACPRDIVPLARWATKQSIAVPALLDHAP